MSFWLNPSSFSLKSKHVRVKTYFPYFNDYFWSCLILLIIKNRKITLLPHPLASHPLHSTRQSLSDCRHHSSHDNRHPPSPDYQNPPSLNYCRINKLIRRCDFTRRHFFFRILQDFYRISFGDSYCFPFDDTSWIFASGTW